MTGPTISDAVGLAERVEAATAPDRELDAAIWLHLPEQEGHAWKHGGDKFAHAHQISGCSFVPSFTASLDAAMTLLDEGWFFHLSRFTDGATSGNAHVYPNRGLGDDYESDAATPALALCAAALRARAATGEAE